MGPHNPLSFVIPILVILPLLYLRLRRMMKPTPLKLDRMWIRPAIFFAVGVLVLIGSPPRAQDWLWFVLAAFAGAGLGWQWGRTMAIHVDPGNGTLMMRGSQAALIMMVLLLAVRTGLRTGAQLESQALHLNAAMITDLFIVFGATLFGFRGLEMFLRARRILAEAPQSRPLPKT